jgi:hypothetical protein
MPVQLFHLWRPAVVEEGAFFEQRLNWSNILFIGGGQLL